MEWMGCPFFAAEQGYLRESLSALSHTMRKNKQACHRPWHPPWADRVAGWNSILLHFFSSMVIAN